MEFQQMDFQFLDLNDIPEKEVNELCEILNPADSNSYVELPWRYETAVNNFSSATDENGDIQLECENEESTLVCYTNYDSTGASHDVTEINTAVAPPPFLPVVTSISYLPAEQPFSFIPHTYPVIPQYLGLPLFTQNVHQQDLNIVQACHYPYPPPISNVGSFTSVTDKTEGQDSKQNGQSSSDKQYLRRNKKKRSFSYYASSEMCVNTDAYQPGSVVLDSQMATMIPLNDQSVLSHNPVVPFNVPPPNYPMTNGTIPMAGMGSSYPHEITMHYSSMANPHTGSAPMFCVPVIPSPYHHGYMPHPTPSTAVHQVVGNGHACDQYLPDVCVTTSDVQNGYNYCETVMNHQPNSDNKSVDLNVDNCVNTCINQQSVDSNGVSDSEGILSKQTVAGFEAETCRDEHGDIQLSELSNTSEVSVSPTLVTVESEVEKKPEWVLGDATSSDISLTDLSENSNRRFSSCSSELSALSVKLTEKSVGVTDKDSCEIENHNEKTSSETDGYVSLPKSVLSGDIQTRDQVEMDMPDSGIQQHRSWADLFKMMSLGNSTSEKDAVTETEAAACTTTTRKVSEVCLKNHVSTDLTACKIAKILISVRLNHAAQFLIPRGLVNRSNWCYVNAILQALLVCPPLYNLLKRLSRDGINRNNSSTPVIDSLTCFMNEFSPMPYGSKRKRKEDLSFGVPFEPHYVYSLLTILKPDCVQDCQQDAEEVLGFLLNGLHEEMVAVLDNFKNSVDKKCNGHEDNLSNGHITEHEPEENKNVTINSMCFLDSPISDIFGGQLTTVLTAGDEISTNLQPFFTLPLDIQADNVQWVNDALAHMTAKESIQDYTCTETKQEVEAFRQSSFSILPLVLILHLKRFVYNRGGPKKILKDVNFSIDLEISEETLSPGVRRKYSARALRSYKLFAVVCHEGKDLSKGHYITDVYHVGSGSWLRCDDSTITVITDTQLLSPSPPRVPYMLFYRRLDTLHPWNPTK
ncbi:ubiquitin carboxyl-terminal hydrolase 10-like [Limulus polyphemus]|uniref:ubiquitinyl hydrolase 1 n=1 Tax=Limulus polyphemus TaxID=6850 RepID=A0ABM1BGL6_LIMPO|nr:ubiquitin carboxyl-terminal hydrolase 10-like [Limulus polyphemus]